MTGFTESVVEQAAPAWLVAVGWSVRGGAERDLQEEIQETIQAFITRALERAEAARAEKRPKTITLSPLENGFAPDDTFQLAVLQPCNQPHNKIT
jgi:hypothetical protein